MSTLIRGGRVLRADFLTCDPADVLVEHGFIRAIEPVGRITRGDVETIEAADRLLVPGLVNGHTHAHGGLGKGAVGDRVPLEVFLSASGVINGSRTVEDKRLSATLTAVELVRKGCTAAYDLFVEYPVPSREGLDAVAEAYGTVGMRAVIAPMMADRTLYEALPGLIESLPPHLQEQARRIQAAPYEASVAAARDVLANWRHDRDKLRPALGPTIPLHCSDAFLVECARLAEEYDVLLQTHLAESKTQAVLGYKKYGRSLVAHLQALNVLGERRARHLARFRRHLASGGGRSGGCAQSDEQSPAWFGSSALPRAARCRRAPRHRHRCKQHVGWTEHVRGAPPRGFPVAGRRCRLRPVALGRRGFSRGDRR